MWVSGGGVYVGECHDNFGNEIHQKFNEDSFICFVEIVGEISSFFKDMILDYFNYWRSGRKSF